MSVLGAKMAENKIAQEIMKNANADCDGYVEYVRYLSNRDCVSITFFPKTELGQHYWIDVRRCFSNMKINPNHVLEVFGAFSNLEPSALRETVIDMLKENKSDWAHRASVVTQMNFISFDEWKAQMANENCMCDELMIFILSKLHYRHTVIYTANRLWCTMRLDKPMDWRELHSKCDIHLVYLGNYTFGEL